jgi:tetratricopeptide (TPR) repeat protein
MKKTMKLALVFAALAALGLAQDDKPKGPVAKDPAEANLINTAAKEPDAAKRLTELDEWKQKYPETEFADARELLYLGTYIQLKQNRQAIDKAKEILTKHPDDYSALSTIVTFGPTMNNNNPNDADFQTTIDAANHMIDSSDKVFADSNRPGTVAADAWPKMKPYWEPQARHVIATMWLNKKDYPRAEQELTKMLQRWPSDAVIDQIMGQVILAEKIPEKQGVALFYYARAACYDGDGSLPAQNRKTLQSGFLVRAYNTFHGSNEGFDQLCQVAKANPAPPADFKVLSTADIAEANAKKEAAEAAANPAMTLWKKVKEGLTGDGADAFFDSVKGAGLPSTDGTMKWKGKLVKATPNVGPKTLVLAVENPEGDVTLSFEMPLRGKMEAGTELEFWGVADSYTKSPYMLTFKVDKENLTGWKPEPVPQHKKSTSSKKSQ